MKKILVTGHLGLVGCHLVPKLALMGYQVVGFDLADNSGDILNSSLLEQAMQSCHGIIHLAAVSRVIWGQNEPDKCWKTNALASEKLLQLAAKSSLKPWVLVSSSREVYGEAEQLPVNEDMATNPVNIYGRAKLYMEQAAYEARAAGVNTAVVRLANVYGCVNDHKDRVIPAFCRNAVLGNPLRVDGFEHLFDFTHVSDTVNGITRVIELLCAGERNLPAIHLLPGEGTTLKQAADFAVTSANSISVIKEATSRSYDVCKFIGNPTRAKALLDWQAIILPKEGIATLVEDFKAHLTTGVCA
jgi:nucleoside-diphosphate-sugar epimerase